MPTTGADDVGRTAARSRAGKRRRRRPRGADNPGRRRAPGRRGRRAARWACWALGFVLVLAGCGEGLTPSCPVSQRAAYSAGVGYRQLADAAVVRRNAKAPVPCVAATNSPGSSRIAYAALVK